MFFLEALAQCVGAWLFIAEFGEAFWTFIDNVEARCSLSKATRNRERHCVRAPLLAPRGGEEDVTMVEHVTNAAQLTDGINRDDWSIPRARGWLCIQPDFTEFWDLLHEIFDSGQLATHEHVARLEEWVRVQRDLHPPVTVA